MPNVFAIWGLPNIKLSNGVTVANCTPYPGGAISASSSINCTIVIDPTLYTSLSGTLSFQYDLYGGGRPVWQDIAALWKVGTNTLTWNGLSFNIDLQPSKPVSQSQYVFRQTGQADPSPYKIYNYYLSPSTLCGGGAIQSGTFTFTTNTTGTIVTSPMNYYLSNTISPFGYPTSYIGPTVYSTSLSANQKTFTVNFGAIPAGYRFAFFAYTNAFPNGNGQGANFDIKVVCPSGKTDQDYVTISMGFVSTPSGTGGNGSLPIITTTQTWTGLYTTTYYTTGTDTIVTAIIEVPQPSTATATTTWTGIYTTSYLTTGSDSSVTNVIEVPSSSGSSTGPHTTLTTTWTGAYTTSYLTTGTDSSVSQVIEVPSTSGPAITTTTWTGAYTTSYLTTGTDSSVTQVIEVPSTSGSPDATLTTTWTGVYTTSYLTTGTDSSVTQVIEVPSTSGSPDATLTTTWTGVYTTSYLTTGTDSSVTQVIEVPSSSGSPDVTLTTTWTGVYTTSYLTTGTDSSVTEVIEVPSTSGCIFRTIHRMKRRLSISSNSLAS
jgi:hypothetical protein